MLKTILLTTAAGLVLSCCSAAEQTAKITPIPNGVELASGSSRLEVQILEDSLVRVHVEPNGKSTPRTLVMDPHESLRPASAVHISEGDGVYTLSSPGITVRIEETQPFSLTFLRWNRPATAQEREPLSRRRGRRPNHVHISRETFYGIHGLGLQDTSVGLTRNEGGKVAAGVQGDSGGPFVFTTRYGLLVDSNGGEFTTAPGSLTFANDSRPDVEYFVLAGPPLETMGALSRLVGVPPIPPEWTLGFLNSQWGSDQSEVEQIVAEYRQKQIPLDGFILDFDWKAWGEDNYGEWRWNSTSGPRQCRSR